MNYNKNIIAEENMEFITGDIVVWAGKQGIIVKPGSVWSVVGMDGKAHNIPTKELVLLNDVYDDFRKELEIMVLKWQIDNALINGNKEWFMELTENLRNLA
jgi:hypothetical protein